MEQRSAPARPLWEHVNELIAVRGWTWSRLAREAGVSRKMLANWKTQPGEPQSASVNAIADVLNIDRTRALQLAGILRRDLSTLTDEQLKTEFAEFEEELNRRGLVGEKTDDRPREEPEPPRRNVM